MTVKGKLNPYYTYGIISMAMPGWALGTLIRGCFGKCFTTEDG